MLQNSLKVINLHKIYKTHKGQKLNTFEQFKIYKHHKMCKNEILNAQITKNDHILHAVITIEPPPQAPHPNHPAFQALNNKQHHFWNLSRMPNTR